MVSTEKTRQGLPIKSIRNPWVPENFYCLYTMFYDQLYHRSTFKSENLLPETRTAILHLANIIEEKGYLHFFDESFVENMRLLSLHQTDSNEQMEQRLREIPDLSKQLRKTRKELTDAIIDRKNLEETKDGLQIKIDVTKQIYRKKLTLMNRRDGSDTRDGWEEDVNIYKQKILGSVEILRSRGFNSTILEELDRKSKYIESLDFETITPEQLLEIYNLDDIIYTFMETDYQSIPEGQLTAKRDVINTMIEAEGGQRQHYETPKHIQKEMILFETWQLESKLFDIFDHKYDAGQMYGIFAGNTEELKAITDVDDGLRKKHEETDGDLKALAKEKAILTEIVKRRRMYGDAWKEQLLKYQETEKEIFIEWGRRMIKAGVDNQYLDFGRSMGYF